MPTFIKGGIWSTRKNIPKIYNGELNLDEFFKSKSSTLAYKVYSALITQTGTSDPEVIELENTIGDIVWTRNSPGLYNATLADAFPEDKTFYVIGKNDIYSQLLSRASVNLIQLATSLPVAPFTNTDNKLNHTAVEIRVYN